MQRDALLLACSERSLEEAATKFPGNPRARMALHDAAGDTTGSPGEIPDECECIPSLPALRSRWTRLTRRNPNVVLLDPPGQETVDIVTTMVQATLANQETTRRHGRRWVRHLLQNFPQMIWNTPAAAALNALKGKPAVIIGAGPSLDRNRAELERLRDHALFIGVNSSTRAVQCDVNVCVESNDIRAKLGEEAHIRCYSLVCPPEHFEHGSGLIAPIWTGELGLLPEQLSGVPRVHSSVGGATAALMLAMTWGCDPIVLVGQDMAYTGGAVYSEATGSRGSVSDDGRIDWGNWADLERPDNPLPESFPLTDVPAWGGVGTVKADPGLCQIRRFFEETPENRRLINATEGGARINGWWECSLSDVADFWAEKPERAPWSVLRNALAASASHVAWQNRGGFRALRAWRDDQCEALNLMAELCLAIQVAQGDRLREMGELLLDGLAACRLLEAWSFEGVLALRMHRQAQEVGTREVELEAAERDLKDASVILAKDSVSLRELMQQQPYEPGQ